MTNYKTTLFYNSILSRLRGIEHPNNRGNAQNKESQKIFSGTLYLCYELDNALVILRTPPANVSWDRLYEFGARLEELSVGDKDLDSNPIC
jgi:hypothetical protein